MLKHLFLFLLLLIISSSCKDENDSFIKIDTYDKQVIEYFPQVALGFENSTIDEVTRKWGEEMKIYLYGNISTSNYEDVEKVRDEVSQLATDGFKISIVQDSIQANLYLFLGSAEEYSQRIPFFRELVEGFSSYFYLYWNADNQLNLSFCFVDNTQLNQIEQAYHIRAVITRSLGFARFPYSHYESIFQGDPYNGTEGYAPIDRDLIRLMYHPNMPTGIEGDTLKNTLLTILINEK